MSQKNNDMSQTDKHDMQICKYILIMTTRKTKAIYTMTKQISKTPYEDLIEEQLLALLEKLWRDYHINNTSSKDQV